MMRVMGDTRLVGGKGRNRIGRVVLLMVVVRRMGMRMRTGVSSLAVQPHPAGKELDREESGRRRRGGAHLYHRCLLVALVFIVVVVDGRRGRAHDTVFFERADLDSPHCVCRATTSTSASASVGRGRGGRAWGRGRSGIGGIEGELGDGHGAAALAAEARGIGLEGEGSHRSAIDIMAVDSAASTRAAARFPPPSPPFLVVEAFNFTIVSGCCRGGGDGDGDRREVQSLDHNPLSEQLQPRVIDDEHGLVAPQAWDEQRRQRAGEAGQGEAQGAARAAALRTDRPGMQQPSTSAVASTAAAVITRSIAVERSEQSGETKGKGGR